MAILNIRDRQLETKIAYVGPELSGRTTNFQRLGGAEIGDDLAAVTWKPTTETTFRDCEVRVRLLAARGDSVRDRTAALLDEVDGVVFVADADPAADERNRVSLTELRDALAKTKRSVPVVVQVNKADLPNALSVAEMTSTLDLGEWPAISASAMRGEGVVETVERAHEMVLDALRSRNADGKDGEGERGREMNSPAREGNPLLTALRHVLRETLTTAVEELETRREGREEAQLATLAHGQDKLLAAVDRLTSRVAELAQGLDAVSKRLATVDAIAKQVATLEGSVKATTAEVTRVVETGKKADRDQLSLATSQIRRSVEGVAPALAAELKTGPTLEQIETSLKRELGAATNAVVSNLATRMTLADDADAGARAALFDRTNEIRQLVEAVAEELKKPKKSWFT